MKTSTLKKKAQKRLTASYQSSLNLLAYGSDNLYPQTADLIVSASPTGAVCLDRYAKFIKGNGFLDVPFSEYVVNRAGESADDLHSLVCEDLARFGGFALHVNYNIFGEIVEVQHFPFQNVRLAECDDDGFISELVTHPDYTGESTRNKKRLSVTAATCERFPIFNPDKSVVRTQIIKAGGPEFYKGQILYVSRAGRMKYPTTIYDSVLTDLSTDEGISNIKYRDVRHGFVAAGIVVTEKGSPVDGLDLSDDELQEELDELQTQLEKLQGDEAVGKLLAVSVGQNEKAPEIKPLQKANHDKLFETTEKSTTERIYAAFNQEAFYRIRTGSVGFSSEMMADAYSLYAALVTPEQRMIERAFTKIFKHWHEVANASNDFSTQPLKYMKL